MQTEAKSRPPEPKWPFDLRVFAVMAVLWAICLSLSAFAYLDQMDLVDPVETIFAGIRFNGFDARLVLIVESGVFMVIAVGVFAHRRWGLLLALFYMIQIVMSHLAFAIAYLPMRSEWMNVRAVASQGPMVVLITLYLWIRACDLIFYPRATEPDPTPPARLRTDSPRADVAIVAK